MKRFLFILLLTCFSFTLSSCSKADNINYFKSKISDYRKEVIVTEFENSLDNKFKTFEKEINMLDFVEEENTLDLFTSNVKLGATIDKTTTKTTMTHFKAKADYDNHIYTINFDSQTQTEVKDLYGSSKSKEVAKDDVIYQENDLYLDIVDKLDKKVLKTYETWTQLGNSIIPYSEFAINSSYKCKYYIDDNVYTLVLDQADNEIKILRQVVFSKNSISLIDINYRKVDEEKYGYLNSYETIEAKEKVTTFKDQKLKPVNTKDYYVTKEGEW